MQTIQTEQTIVQQPSQQGPKEWGDLWEAMDANPQEWIETTEEMYDEMLNAVFPAAMASNMFLVGEARRHNDDGQAVYACFKKLGDKIVAKHITAAEFQRGAN